jgi:diguanylate cyclase (GGDEF)-like protein
MSSAIYPLLLTAALCVVMLFVLASLGRSGIPGVHAWALANGAAMLSLLLFAASAGLPAPLAVEMPEALLGLSICALYAGFRRFLGRPTPYAVLGAGFILMLGAIAWFHYVIDDADKRMAITSLLHGALSMAIAADILRPTDAARSPYAYRFTATAALLFAGGHLGRALAHLAHPRMLAGAAPSLSNSFYLALGTVALPVLTMGAVMMVHERMLAQAEDMANRDYLTGAWNRRALFRFADRELQRARRTGRPLSLLVLDVDHFKRINDRHGHAQGDRVLVDLTAQAGAIIRRFDLFARLGGEEFALLLPEADAEAALHAAQRLRLAMQRTLPNGAGAIAYTVSIGVATLRDDESFSGLLGRADVALYAAKEAGRNTVRMADEQANPFPPPGTPG